MNPEDPLDEDELRRFFSAAGLPAAARNVQLDRAQLSRPRSFGPLGAFGSRRVMALGGMAALAGLVGLLWWAPTGSVTSSSAAGKAPSHAGLRDAPPQKVVAVVVQYLAERHQRMGPFLSAAVVHEKTAMQDINPSGSVQGRLWRVNMVNLQKNGQGIVLPVVHFYINETTQRVLQVAYGPVSASVADNVAKQWAENHRADQAVPHLQILSTTKVSAPQLHGDIGRTPKHPDWVWQVRYRMNPQAQAVQVVEINPDTGWVMAVPIKG